MMNLLWTAVVLASAAAIYLRWVRPALRQRAELAAFYDRADAIRQKLWNRLKGVRSLIIGFGGLALTILPDVFDQLQLLDLEALGISTGISKAIGQMVILAMIVMRVFTNTAVGEQK